MRHASGLARALLDTAIVEPTPAASLEPSSFAPCEPVSAKRELSVLRQRLVRECSRSGPDSELQEARCRKEAFDAFASGSGLPKVPDGSLPQKRLVWGFARSGSRSKTGDLVTVFAGKSEEAYGNAGKDAIAKVAAQLGAK
ncbi:MAG: hypothetical protein IPM79_27810 [Polyangiaceae bacterium]|nr:hypothetical protein [Polyangiaceae bacterium]MBK8941310.1 hypothetical protein [Polyangiaceae bacterium]